MRKAKKVNSFTFLFLIKKELNLTLFKQKETTNEDENDLATQTSKSDLIKSIFVIQTLFIFQIFSVTVV